MTIPTGLLDVRRRWATAALSALFVLCWASGFIGAKLGAEEAAVPTVLMWRFLPLALLLAPFLVSRNGAEAGAPRPTGSLGRQVAIGVLSQSGYLLSVYAAIDLGVSTGTTALIDGIQPLVAAALVGPLLGIAVRGRQWIGLVLGLGGAIVVSWADATADAARAPLWAYLVPVAGMLCLVAATFLERRAPTRTPPLRVLAIHCSTSAVIFSALAVLQGAAAPPASTRFWIATTWLVVLSTFGGYGLYWLLLERIGVTRVNSLMFAIAPVTTVWGAVVFGEPVTPLTIAGLAVALTATWVVARESPRPVRTG